MKKSIVALLSLVCLPCFADGRNSLVDGRLPQLPNPAQVSASTVESRVIELFAGETRVISAPDVGRIAVGSNQVLTAAAIDKNEVLIMANQPGLTSLLIWNNSDEFVTYTVEVVAGNKSRENAQLAEYLRSVAGAKVTVVGDKVFVEGEGLSDLDLAKIEQIASQYEQVLNLTNRLGWEKMIQLEVVVAEFPVQKLRELGVKWGTSASGPVIGLGVDDASRAVLTRPGANALGFAFPTESVQSYLGISSVLGSEINLLAQSGEAVVLARPTLSARNGSEAQFKAGGEIPYQVVGSTGTAGVQFKQYGVVLKFQPRVGTQGQIRSTIETEVSDVDPSLATSSGPALRIRSTKTEFNLKLGQTLVLSGFLSHDSGSSIDKLPGLGDLPLLGALFRSERFQRKETELVVFVTPSLTGPEAERNQQAIQNTHEKLRSRLSNEESSTSEMPGAGSAIDPAGFPFSFPGEEVFSGEADPSVLLMDVPVLHKEQSRLAEAA